MAAQVVNTDAQINGKTLVMLEGVAAGAAMVPNLDADKLDGKHLSELGDYLGAWQSYTPVWANLSVGNGTVEAKYVKIGKFVAYRIGIVFGATTSITGSVVVSLPVAALAINPTVYPSFGPTVGYGECLDAGVSSTSLMVRLTSATEIAPLVQGSSGVYIVNGFVTADVPFAWGAGDVLTVSGFYEAA